MADTLGQPFGLIVRFNLVQGAAAGFDELVSQTVEKIRSQEPDTLVYSVHQLENQPEVRIFYELYKDRHAFETHEAQPHTKHFLAEREQYLESFEVDFLSVMTAMGINA